MRSKNSLIRERVIDSCLSDKTRRWSIQDIMDAVNQILLEQCEEQVTASNTIRDDIRAIESRCGIKVLMTRDGRRKFYRYEDPGFSIYHVALSPEEKEHLRLAMDENPYLRGIGYLTDLMDAIAHHRPVRLTYKPYNQTEPRTMTFNPYCLKQWNNRWFVLGCNEGFHNVTNYALDRIEALTPCAADYMPNPGYDFRTLFDDVIGVTIPMSTPTPDDPVPHPLSPVTLRLWVSPEQWPYTQTKPLHGSQKVKQRNPDGSAEIELTVIPNHELEQRILELGEGIEVLAPPAFRTQIAHRIMRMAERYKE